jgi:hypothetical protein
VVHNINVDLELPFGGTENTVHPELVSLFGSHESRISEKSAISKHLTRTTGYGAR